VSLKVSEIFFSLQGEGPLVGFPTFFVRLYGCNLKCTWCDTPYARCGEDYRERAPEEIVRLWKKEFPEIPYVTITGGEPLLQKETYALMEAFLEEGAVVVLETNGSLSLKEVPDEVIVVMDLKTPSSGMAIFNLLDNLALLTQKDALKFVIKDEEDFTWSLEMIERFGLLRQTTCFFSPCEPFMDPHLLSQKILATKKPIRFQVQLHKLLKIK